MQTYHIKTDRTGREVDPHGTTEFPVAVYTTQIRKNLLGFIDWHWHQELQFCRVIRGEVEFQIESRVLRLREGEGLFVAPGLLHRAKNAPGTDSAYICLNYHPQLMQHAEESLLDRTYVDPYLDSSAGYCVLSPGEPWQQELLQHIVSLRDESESGSPDFFAMYLRILRVWHLLYRGYLCTLSVERQTPHSDTVQRIVHYIGAHYAEPLRLDELAASVSLAESTCCRLFKKNMGCTIFEYIGNVRLLQSERLLLETGLSVTEIAMQCGFGSASYYNRSFKTKTGLSPRAYRQKFSE